MQSEYESLLACRLSGQIEDAAWQEHLQDEDFASWLREKDKADKAFANTMTMDENADYEFMGITWPTF